MWSAYFAYLQDMYPFLLRCFPIWLILLTPGFARAQGLSGTWTADLARSVDIDPWRSFQVSLAIDSNRVTVDRSWTAGRYSQHDSFTVPVGQPVDIDARPGKWMDHVYLGVFVPPAAVRRVQAELSADSRVLTLTTVTPVQTSQIDTSVTVISEYRLDADPDWMTLDEQRSSRAFGPPLRFVFRRE
jgi:hypothetical protein